MVDVRVGIPLTGGKLVRAAREQGRPVLFSANAFSKVYPKTHPRAGFFKEFKLPDPAQFEGLDAALDSAGFVAASKYGDFRWSVEEYLDLVASHPWTWWASMDYCCEPQVAQDRPLRILRIAATARMYAVCSAAAAERGLKAPMPVLQGWTANEYAECVNLMPITHWPDLVGIGSVCRRNVKGEDGILAILQAIDPILPPHVKLHLFGVKSSAMGALATHPRVAAVDSMAWDVAARRERPTGRDMDFRIEHMNRWADRQSAIAEEALSGSRGDWAAQPVQCALFSPEDFQCQQFTATEDLFLEAIAHLHANFILGGDLEYRDAVSQCSLDGFNAIRVLRHEGSPEAAARRIDEEFFSGFYEQFCSLSHTQPTELHPQRPS